MTLQVFVDDISELSEELQGQYKQSDDGGYVLDVGDLSKHPSMVSLKDAADAERKKARQADKEKRDVQKQLDELSSDREDMLKGAVPKDDVDKLEQSYKQKLTKMENSMQEKLDSANQQLQTMLVDNVAQQMAGELSDSPDLLMPHIKNRLTSEEVDGSLQTRVLDSDGNASALSVEDLKNEIKNDSRFAPAIVGSRASGGGAQGGRTNGSADKSFKDMTEQERVELYRSDLETYRRLRDEQQQHQHQQRL